MRAELRWGWVPRPCGPSSKRLPRGKSLGTPGQSQRSPSCPRPGGSHTEAPPSLLRALLGGSTPTAAMATHCCLPGGQTASCRNLHTGPRPSSLSLIRGFCRPPPPASLVGTRALNGVGPGFEFHLRLPRLLLSVGVLWARTQQREDYMAPGLPGVGIQEERHANMPTREPVGSGQGRLLGGGSCLEPELLIHLPAWTSHEWVEALLAPCPGPWIGKGLGIRC